MNTELITAMSDRLDMWMCRYSNNVIIDYVELTSDEFKELLWRWDTFPRTYNSFEEYCDAVRMNKELLNGG